jgi:hypothetical protein
MHDGRSRIALTMLMLICAWQPLAGQSTTTWVLGAGVSVPSGVLADYADKGWNGTVGVERSLGRHPFSVRLDFTYAVNSDTTGIGFDETTRFIVAMANIVYHFQGAKPHLYALVGLGYVGRRFSTDDPDDSSINDAYMGFQLGEGIVFPIRSARVFTEGRFISQFGQSPLSFFSIMAGVRLGGGKP